VTKKSVLAGSLSLRFSAPNQRVMGAADGSIMAAIMTVHMVSGTIGVYRWSRILTGRVRIVE
jgi:hypothetical protein